MRKSMIPLMAAAALLGVACQTVPEQDIKQDSFVEKEEPVEQEDPLYVVKAGLEDPEDTKTALDGNLVLWSAGDAIQIYNASHPQGVTYTLSEGAGSTLGSFAGAPISGSGPFYAVYPASVAGSLSGSTVSVSLPQVQEMAAGSFGPGANVAMAKADDLEDGLAFKNALGALCFTLSGSPAIQSVRVQARGGEALWGEGTLKWDNDKPTLQLSENDTDHQALYLEGSAQAGPFYLMLPPDAMEGGFMVEFADNTNMVMLGAGKASAEKKITRNRILGMPEMAFTRQIKRSFLEPATFGFGGFDNVGVDGSLDAFTFDKLSCQYATWEEPGEYCYQRLQSLTQGKLFAVTAPYEFALGGRYQNVKTTFLSGSTYYESALDYILVRTTAQGAWFVSTDLQKGFILQLED